MVQSVPESAIEVGNISMCGKVCMNWGEDVLWIYHTIGICCFCRGINQLTMIHNEDNAAKQWGLLMGTYDIGLSENDGNNLVSCGWENPSPHEYCHNWRYPWFLEKPARENLVLHVISDPMKNGDEAQSHTSIRPWKIWKHIGC